jgi:GABA permease
MTMISLGGVIGAGLFIASGPVINGVGPAAILTYALTGILLVLIMRMLGEMAVAWPSWGPFPITRGWLSETGPDFPSGGCTGISG